MTTGTLSILGWIATGIGAIAGIGGSIVESKKAKQEMTDEVAKQVSKAVEKAIENGTKA